MSNHGHFPPARKEFREGQSVLVRHLAGWGDRRRDRERLLAVVVMATPQFGDTYQVRFEHDGHLDIIDVDRLESAE